MHLKDRTQVQDEYEKTPFVSSKGIKYFPCAVGHGYMQIEAILEKLAERKYSGNVIIEIFGSKVMMKKLLQSITWLKEHINNRWYGS